MLNQKILTSISIIIGFAMVSAAIIFSDFSYSFSDSGNKTELTVKRQDSAWWYGDKNAKTTIVEFSDYECPYCSRVHPVIKQIVDESNGTINWQYRHYPLPIHKHAVLAAQLAECVGDSLGNEAFWNYTDKLFNNQNLINEPYLRQIAKELGLSDDDVLACESDEKIANRIENDVKTMEVLGGNGTPFSVILKEDGSMVPVRGALPYDNWLDLLK